MKVLANSKKADLKFVLVGIKTKVESIIVVGLTKYQLNMQTA